MALTGLVKLKRSAQVRREWQVFLAGLILVDAGAIGLALALAAWLYPGRGEPSPEGLFTVAVGLIPVLLLLFWSRGLYQRRYLLGGPGEYSRVISACTYGVVVLIAASYFAGGGPLVSRGLLLIFWGLSIVLVGAGRFAARRLAYRLRQRGHFVSRVLLAGVDAHSAAIAQQLSSPEAHGTEVIGFLDDFLPQGTTVLATTETKHGTSATLSVLGSARSARELAAQFDVDLLIVNPQALAWESAQQILLETVEHRSSVEMRLVPLPYDILAVGVETASLGYVPLLSLKEHRITDIDAVLKRMFDVMVAGLLISLAFPFVAMAVLRARLGGTESLLERRLVVGRFGAHVPLPLLDRQVTQQMVLRGWPALWAVLRGHLSIVGPRPRQPWEKQGDVPHRDTVIQAVKPGLTGPWRFFNRDTPFSPDYQLAQDLWYIRNYTIWQDLFLVWQTGRAMVPLGQKGLSTRLWRWELGSRRESARPVVAEPVEAIEKLNVEVAGVGRQR